MSKDKPIPVKKYRCPKCNHIIEGSYKEAQEHIDIPIDTPLPTGFVYKDKELDSSQRVYGIISSKGELTENHGFNQKRLIFDHGKLVGRMSNLYINSIYFKGDLKSKKICLLTPKEFDDFKLNYSALFPSLLTPKPNQLIRTTLELEKLVNLN